MNKKGLTDLFAISRFECISKYMWTLQTKGERFWSFCDNFTTKFYLSVGLNTNYRKVYQMLVPAKTIMIKYLLFLDTTYSKHYQSENKEQNWLSTAFLFKLFWNVLPVIQFPNTILKLHFIVLPNQSCCRLPRLRFILQNWM